MPEDLVQNPESKIEFNFDLLEDSFLQKSAFTEVDTQARLSEESRDIKETDLELEDAGLMRKSSLETFELEHFQPQTSEDLQAHEELAEEANVEIDGLKATQVAPELEHDLTTMTADRSQDSSNNEQTHSAVLLINSHNHSS